MTDRTLEAVREYHRAWTLKDFDRACSLLATELEVEVPINEYPTKQSFCDALRSFGGLVRGVDVLAEMSSGSAAMLLYDLDAEGLGGLRVAEHFTVVDGAIVRLRQIHDTAPVRAWLSAAG